MAVVVRIPLSTVRSGATSAGNGAPPPESRKSAAASATARPLLSVSKPNWVVRTESNVRKERTTAPDPPCVVCRGSGRVDCYNCNGNVNSRGHMQAVFTSHAPSTIHIGHVCGGGCPCGHCLGRTNHVELTMLPKGEWPKWCRSCGGSGLAYCARCLGTGEYRYIMGFHFMNKDTDRSQDNPRNHQSSHSFTDLLLNNDQSESGRES